MGFDPWDYPDNYMIEFRHAPYKQVTTFISFLIYCEYLEDNKSILKFPDKKDAL
jgi:hypothetical protein